MNKGEFDKAFSAIVKKYPCRTKIVGKDKQFLLEACRGCSRYATLATDPNTEVRVGNHTIASNRKVKMIFLHKDGGAWGVPVSKKVVVDTLYPPKPRKGKGEVTPEKKHRNQVLSAMRHMVDYQLSDYRQSVTYPIECWRSGFALRKGMKTDVDHIGDPFIKLAEDFLRDNGLLFVNVFLKGRANAKVFRDDSLAAAWKKFHQERAVLALVLSSENRSVGCGGYEVDESLLGSFTGEGEEGSTLSLDF